MQYIILKQFVSGAEIWVAKLTPEDTEYSYDTLEEAETALPTQVCTVHATSKSSRVIRPSVSAVLLPAAVYKQYDRTGSSQQF